MKPLVLAVHRAGLQWQRQHSLRYRIGPKTHRSLPRTVLAESNIASKGMNLIKKLLLISTTLLLIVFCFPGLSYAKDEGDRAKLQDRLNKAGTILNQVTAAPDKGIPQEILAHAECVGVIPSLMKAGFGFGGEYGQGVVTCRTAHGWSAPAFYRLGGGSFGLQIGGEAVDLVMLFMNDKGVHSLLAHKIKIGVDASASAGPVGRTAAADTNIALQTEILTYSRSRGIFAGISLKGAWIEQNGGDTRTFYGRDINFRAILSGTVRPPAGSEGFLSAVRKDFGEAKASR